MRDRLGRRCESRLQHYWRDRLPAEKPVGIDSARWVLFLLHVRDGMTFVALAELVDLGYDQVRDRCHAVAAQLERALRRSA